MIVAVPDFALVVLVGASGAGKSTFARRHFAPDEIVSSDRCRGIVAGDENDQAATPDAFELLRTILDIRLRRRLLTVVDATNVRAEDRRALLDVARRHTLAVAVVLDPGERVCHERNAARPDRAFGPHVVRNQLAALRRHHRGLKREGFSRVVELNSAAAIAEAVVARQPLWTDRRGETGPFDIIGDVHGCCDELQALLTRLGYAVADDAKAGSGHAWRVTPPPGRRAVFVGDLIDRGPRVADTLRLVMAMVEAGHALCTLGNHEDKLGRWLRGRAVKVAHGLERTIAELDAAGPAFKEEVRRFIDGRVSHYILDGGRLAVAHAGIKEEMIGRASAAVRDFCLWGETTGETDAFGLPVRHDWAADYRGEARVVYGHTPVPDAEWLNNTLCLDTGCVFGGRLSALRYPELELVAEPARHAYAEPVRPLRPSRPEGLTARQEADDLLDLADVADVAGKRFLTTALVPKITVRAENAAAALEVMSRFAVDPRWLIHLPPTMSPPETSEEEGFLEHPAEAFAYFRRQGVARVVVQEKHMGSRAILVVCRDAATAGSRFGVATGETGCSYTRSGRPFFPDPEQARAVLERTASALERAGIFAALASDWVWLDAEIMPWSFKARSLIERQYAPVAAAARLSLDAARAALRRAGGHGAPVEETLARTERHAAGAEAFGRVVERYSWPVAALDDLRIAPFHLLASEGAAHHDRPHLWHVETLAGLAAADPLFRPTAMRAVDLADGADKAEATRWWLELTAAGGEGMVVKPWQPVSRAGDGRLVQPALKCRGRDYLRIIYGVDYDTPESLGRLRRRDPGFKRTLAVREWALGLEALDRFVAKEPLRRVHECVFAVLALESEPVDPRL